MGKYLEEIKAKRLAEQRNAPVQTSPAGDYEIHTRPAQDDLTMDAIYATKNGVCVSDKIFLPIVQQALDDAGIKDTIPEVVGRGLIKLRKEDTEAVLEQLNAGPKDKVKVHSP